MKSNSFRTVGEFEKQESILMSWPNYETSCESYNMEDVSVEIVKNLIGNVDLIISSFDEDVTNRAKRKLKENGINIENILFVEYPSVFFYPRDFGAEVLINDKGERALVDFDFASYGFLPKEDPVSRVVEGFDRMHGELVNVDTTIFTRLISEGGDREFNGNGVMMTIEDTEVNKRNKGMTKEQVEEEFKRIFNLEKVIWIPYATYDDENMFDGPIIGPDGTVSAYRSASANGHIDEMCRFVSEDTILLAEITEEEAKENKLHALNKERLDKAYEVLKNATDINGKPFKIIRMPFPETIYLELKPGDKMYEEWQIFREDMNGKFLDGSEFPTGNITVIPALSYCNFLITNNIVIAQKYYREGMSPKIKEKDEKALNILKSIFKDRTVVAIDTTALNVYGGGVHCNTRNVPSRDLDKI
ncbi:putative agmatine deiminase [Gottschalkia purinilytica]|uniref:Putative agmatine deiminase n=1 Tax=Gottschalkia purinilytica TaxID=1503 RepID=A0A0L0W6E9_GOTPU|nr:agmatine deiminase family protein [Gottschalkia purinilytica]KNF07061.1 putative agmatine deiminase [Gottschalkia purinilytica]